LKTTLCLFILVFCVATPQAEASIKVGQYISKSSKNAIKKSVYWGDLIETSPKETAELVLFPKFVLSLGPSTRLKVVGNLIWKKGAAVMAEGSLALLSGSLHAKLAHPSGTEQTMKVIAARSISSIRGTELFINADRSSSSVFVKEGTVEVKDLQADGTKTLVSGGTGLKLKAGSENQKLSKNPSSSSSTLHLNEVDADWKSVEADLIAGQAPQFEALRTKYDNAFEQTVSSIEKEAAEEPKKMESEFNDFMKEDD
jgi:hypothetical protein